MSQQTFPTQSILRLSPTDARAQRSAESLHRVRVQMKAAVPAFVLAQSDGPLAAVTLTMRQHITRRTDGGSTVERFKVEDKEKLVSAFRRRLSRRVFGTACRRGGKAVKGVLVVERAPGEGRYHLHGALAIPEGWKFEEFRIVIDGCWRQMEWSLGDTMITPIDDEAGWARYISKQGIDAIALS